MALNASDGKLRWKTDAGGTFSASPAADETTLYVAMENPTGDKNAVRGTLRALSKDTGITLWMRTLQAPLRGRLAAGPNALFAGAANGVVNAFDNVRMRSGQIVTATDSTHTNADGDRLYSHPCRPATRLHHQTSRRLGRANARAISRPMAVP